MFFRRFFFRLALLGVASVFSCSLFAQTAETTLTADVLAKTLFAKTPTEKKYCENVIAARDAKILPDRILYAAYRYAMKKDKDRRFMYFQIVLPQFCKEAGVTLPTTITTKTSHKPFSLFTNPFK